MEEEKVSALAHNKKMAFETNFVQVWSGCLRLVVVANSMVRQAHANSLKLYCAYKGHTF